MTIDPFGLFGDPGYFEKMVAGYGEQRAKAILDENRHNTSYFPNFTVKGPIEAIRVFKPIAPDRTLAEFWTFRWLMRRTNCSNAPSTTAG